MVDFTAVPPVLIHVGEDEIFLDDSRRFTERIGASGGLAQLHIWEGTTHVFPSSIDQFVCVGLWIRKLKTHP
jgi:monoterpene epsilon-lactone hydrolase